MKLKKIMAIGLICTMTASAFAGCGGAKKEETAKTEDGKVKIDFWYSGGKTAVGVLGDMVEEFNASQDQYEINSVTQADYDETYEKLQAGIAGKKAPDMALLDVDKARNLSRKDLVADIQPFVDDDKAFEKEDYIEVFYNQGIDDGKLLHSLHMELLKSCITIKLLLKKQVSRQKTLRHGRIWRQRQRKCQKERNSMDGSRCGDLEI